MQRFWQRAAATISIQRELKAKRLAQLGPSVLAMLHVGVSVGQRLDRVIYPELSSNHPLCPLVVVGNPRSGTTFLQRSLIDLEFGKGQTVLHQLAPSRVIQQMLRPISSTLESISPTRHHDQHAHQGGIQAVETDDASLFFRYLDGFFLYGFFWAHFEEDCVDWVDQRLRNTQERDFDWLERCWRQNVIDERPLAKLFSIGAQLPAFVDAFPDAQIIYLARDPLETIPSTLSMVTSVLESRYRIKLSPSQLSRFSNRMAAALIELLRRFVCDLENHRIPAERIFLLPYQRLVSDWESVVSELCQWSSHELSSAQWSNVTDTALLQRQRTSLHRYQCQDFGLDERWLRSETAFFEPYWR